MAGKKSTKSASEKPKKFYLLWFPKTNEGKSTFDVVKRTSVPSGYREVGRNTRLPYGKGKAQKFYDCKIVGEGDDAVALGFARVNAENGELMPLEAKCYPEHILASKRQVDREVRDNNKALKASIKHQDASLLSLTPVVSMASTKPVSPTLSSSDVAGSSEPLDESLPASSTELSVGDVSQALWTSVRYNVTSEVQIFLEVLSEAAKSLSAKNSNAGWLHSILHNMCKSAETQKKDLQLPMMYLQNSDVCPHDLFGNQTIFVPAMVGLLIKTETEVKGNGWKDYVAVVLNYLYGDKLALLSAKGKRNTTGINKKLYKSLYEKCLVSDFPDPPAGKEGIKSFNRCINLLSQHKRQANVNEDHKKNRKRGKELGENEEVEEEQPHDKVARQASQSITEEATHFSRPVGEENELQRCASMREAEELLQEDRFHNYSVVHNESPRSDCREIRDGEYIMLQTPSAGPSTQNRTFRNIFLEGAADNRQREQEAYSQEQGKHFNILQSSHSLNESNGTVVQGPYGSPFQLHTLSTSRHCALPGAINAQVQGQMAQHSQAPSKSQSRPSSSGYYTSDAIANALQVLRANGIPVPIR